MTPEEIQAELKRLTEADAEALKTMQDHHNAGLAKTGLALSLHRRGADIYVARACQAWQELCRFKERYRV